MLLELINQSLDSLGTSIVSSKVITNTRSKASKKNNKKKTTTDNINIIIVDIGIGIVIPFEAAIDLLVSYDISDHVHAVCYDDEKQQQQQQQSILSSIFIKVRHHCEASMDGMLTIDDDHHHALEAVNESLCKAIKVWLSRSIRSDALLLLEGVHTTDAFSELMNVIQWCDDKVIKNVVSLSMDNSSIVSTTTTISFNIFMIMLAELSDIIYLHLADHNVYRTISNWIEETMMLGDHYHPTEALVSSLQPLVTRLVSLICISPSSAAVVASAASTNSNNEDEGKDETWTQMHRLRHVLLKYLLTTITFGKGMNNQKLILALLAANPTVHDDMLRTAAIHVLHTIIQSPDNGDDFQSTAHTTTLSILNQLTSIKLLKQTHKVIIELKSTLHTTTISTNNTCSIHASNEYDAVCKLLTIVEQLSIDRNTTNSSSSNSGTQVTAVGKDRSIIQSSALKSAVVPLSSATIDPEHWTTI